MTRPLRAQRWPEPESVEEERPAVPSLERQPWDDPWRTLRSSFAIRFIGPRGGELDVDQVNPQAREELVAALDARQKLGSTYATLKRKDSARVSKSQLATLELLVFGFIEVRLMKSGEFRLDFRSFGRKARFNVQQLYATVFELRRLA